MRNAGLVIAAALSMAAAAPMTANSALADKMHVLPVSRPVSETVRKAIRSGGVRHLQGGYKCGPGWTYAQVKRMAKKARTVARHKAQCKGGGKGGSTRRARRCRA